MPSVGVSSRLISVPAQNSAAWTQRTADITDYIGYKARLLILYQSGTSFTGDIQLDDFSIGGNTFDPETGVNGFEKQTVVVIQRFLLGIWTTYKLTTTLFLGQV